MKVNSSMISEIDYSGETLTITFTSGRVYEYEGVSGEGYSKFMEAESKGQYFHENINGRFPTKRIK